MIGRLLDYVNLAGVLNSRGRYDEALAACALGLGLEPRNALLYVRLAQAYHGLGAAAEAVEAGETALRLAPDSVEARVALAAACEGAGDPARALALAREALAAAPDDPLPHCALATHLLWRGELGAGLREQAWHWRGEAGVLAARYGARPQWDGSAVPGLRLLVAHEQGVGDMIQMARYLPEVRARVGRVIVTAVPEVAALVATLAGVDDVVPRGEPLAPERYDAYVRMMSLPELFGTELAAIPARVPYVVADPGAVAAWTARVRAPGVVSAGLVWAGNPGHSNDRERSLPLAALAPLAEIPRVRWYALQKGPGAGDPAPPGLELARLGPELDDFTATAAVVAALDLVVTVDTSVAHLAGALGRPVWTLLPRWPDWRWMLERDDSPWYPTMRLFRQTQRGGWDAVVAAVGEALRARA